MRLPRWFYAYLMGWQRIAVYDGGWFEWSQDPASPIEVGEEADEAVAYKPAEKAP